MVISAAGFKNVFVDICGVSGLILYRVIMFLLIPNWPTFQNLTGASFACVVPFFSLLLVTREEL